MSITKRILFGALTFLAPTLAQAYYSTMTTGELLGLESHKLTAETQFVTSSDEGVNFIGHYEKSLDDESAILASIGVGTTDFQIGTMYKWIPIPDIDKQPAMGLLAGVSYASFDEFDDLSLRIHPLVSKKFELEIGELIPYAALPFGIRSTDGENDFPLQLVLGSEWNTLKFDKVKFLAEIGLNLSDAFTYFSIGASLEWGADGMSFE